jgi:outer membrane usher protein
MQPLFWKPNDNGTSKKRLISLIIIFFLFVSNGLFSQSLGIIPFPLSIDSEAVGEIDVSVDDVDGLRVPLQQLKIKLNQLISEEAKSKLNSLPPLVSPDDLKTRGITLFIDETNLLVSIVINPKQKAIRTISLNRDSSPITGYMLEPADFSFNINFSITQSLELETMNSSIYQSSPLSLSINPTINFKGIHINSNLNLQTNSDSIFSMNSLSANYDHQELGICFSAGNINTDSIPFQSNPASVGFLVSNKINQTTSFRGSFTQHIYLEEKSKIEVYVNNTLRKIFHLPSGRYILENFSLLQGVNNISLDIFSDTGKVSSEQFIIGFDPSTLAQAETKYSYGIGYDSWDIDFSKLPVVFGNQKYGFTDNLTAGFGFQVAESYHFAEIDSVLVTNIGTFNVSGALSQTNDLGYGSAFFARYTYTQANFPKFGLSGTFTSDLFLPHNSIHLQSTKPIISLTASSGHQLFSLLGLSGSLTMEAERDTHALSLTGDLRASIKISDSLSLTGSASLSSNNEDLNWTGSLQLTYHPDSNTTLTANSNIIDGNSSINYYHTPENWNGSGSISANISGISPDDLLPEQVTASGNFKTQYFNTSFRQQAAFSETISDPVLFSTSLTVSTALSYADGLFGISRPISNSFVIIGPKFTTDGLVLGIRTSDQTVNSSDNIFGTVVIPNLSNSSNNRIQVEIIDLPVGFDPGQSTALFKPSRSQGAAFKIGTNAVVYAQGRLFYADEQPAGLLLGTVTNLSDDTIDPQYIFTDQQGTFFIYDLSPGKYEVKVEVNGWEEYILDIQQGMSGLIDLGDFHLSEVIESITTSESLIDTYTSPTVIINEKSAENIDNMQESLSVIPSNSKPALLQSAPKDLLGRFLYEDQSSVPFCNGGIVKVNDDSFESQYFTTDLNGEFQLNALAPGEYELTFFYINKLHFPLTIPDNSDTAEIVEEYILKNSLAFTNDLIPETPETRIVKTFQEPENLEIQIPDETFSVSIAPPDSSGNVTGHIATPGGTPLPYLNAQILENNSEHSIASPIFFSTDFDGAFSIPVIPPGTYNLQFFYYEIMEYQLIVPIATSNLGDFHLSLDDTNII